MNGEVVDERNNAQDAQRVADAINSAAGMADSQHVAGQRIAPDTVVLRLTGGRR